MVDFLSIPGELFSRLGLRSEPPRKCFPPPAAWRRLPGGAARHSLSVCLSVWLPPAEFSSRPPLLPDDRMRSRRFLLGLCLLSYACCCALAATCKLKAKFNLSGYKDVEKKKVVVGGMFPVHKSIVSSDGNTSRLPVSSDCQG